MDGVRSVLGEELRRIRIDRRITPTQLARLSGVSRARIYAIESGAAEKPYTDTLMKLAAGLVLGSAGKPDAVDQARIYRALHTAMGQPVEEPPPPIPIAGRITRTEDLDLPVYRSHAGRLIIADPTPIDHWRIRADRTYTVEVVGNCLFGQDINEGDLLLVDRERPPGNDDVVVVRIGDETYLSRWKRKNGSVVLEMSDGQFREALVHDVDVQGVVMNVIKPKP